MPVIARPRPRHPRGRRRSLRATALAAALACSQDQIPTEPDLKNSNGAPLTVSPTALQFAIPRATPAALTATVQFASDITASIVGSCATVSPPTVTATKPPGNSLYTATFTVDAVELGSCSIALADKKGRQVVVPVDVIPSLVDLRQETLTAGAFHTCALATGGTPYCWGENDLGRLGDGTTTDRPTPTPVSGGLTFTSLTAGGIHTCGLTSAGAAWCWGSNGVGQLGDGTVETEQHVPTVVQGPGGGPALSFIRLTAGTMHTCGLTEAGAAYCWGRSFEGQLGDGTLTHHLTPARVAGDLLFADLEADAHHTCGLTSDGRAYCWGLNEDGQLGDGTTEVRIAPTPVSGGRTFTSLAAGGGFGSTAHNCGRTGAGGAWCWGDNGFGQLGDGSTTERHVPTLVSGGLSWTNLTGGGAHTCGLSSAGAAYCWGNNVSGEVGDQSNTNRDVPAAVAGPGGGAALTFASLTAGNAHSCGRAGAGAIYCWGANPSGQLGDGSGAPQNTPSAVTLP